MCQTWALAAQTLRLLLAVLSELLPWLHHWQPNVDPAYGVSFAESIEALLDAECPHLRTSESAGAPSGIANLERRRN